MAAQKFKMFAKPWLATEEDYFNVISQMSACEARRVT